MRTLVAVVFGLALGSASLAAGTFGAAASFPHLFPTHVDLECSACHSLKANQADLHEMPGHPVCAACHNFAGEAVNRTEGFCGACHNSTAATKDNPALFSFPRRHAAKEFGDGFSHVAHRNAGPATRCDAPGVASQSQCADCHASRPASSPDKQPEKQLEASHAFCFACHCENPRGYTAARKNLNPSRNDCAACHVANLAQLTALPEIRDFRHADHVYDTRPRLKTAGPVSRDPDRLCVECHKTAAESRTLSEIRQPAAATCRSCHTGKPGLPDALPADLLTPLEAGK